MRSDSGVQGGSERGASAPGVRSQEPEAWLVIVNYAPPISMPNTQSYTMAKPMATAVVKAISAYSAAKHGSAPKWGHGDTVKVCRMADVTVFNVPSEPTLVESPASEGAVS